MNSIKLRGNNIQNDLIKAEKTLTLIQEYPPS